MKTMKNKLITKLRCPDCQSPLKAGEKSLTCSISICNRELPIVNGIIIFLSQKQLTDFFKREEIGKYLASENKIKQVLESKNFIDGLKEIIEHVSSDEFQKKYEAETCQWAGDLNNKEAETANKKTTEVLAEKVHIQNADTILDWPTGKGCFLRTILNKVKSTAQIACLDIDFVELASLKVFLERKNKAKNILFVNADARHFPFTDETFDAVTAWGGFIEVPESPKAVKESYRVLKPNGWFAGNGEVYKQNSESMKIADKMGIGHLATKERIRQCLNEAGLKNIFCETLFEGEDQTVPGPDQAPLPAYGDWYGLVVAGGQK